MHKATKHGKHHKSGWGPFKKGISEGWKATKQAARSVHKDVRDAASGVGKLTKEAIKESASVAKTAITAPTNAMGGLAKTAVWPIAIGAVALGGIYLVMNRGSVTPPKALMM